MSFTEPAVLVGLLGPAERPERLLVRLADGRQEVTALLGEAAARAVAASCLLRPAHATASLTHWIQGGLPIRVSRSRASANNSGPVAFAGFETRPDTTGSDRLSAHRPRASSPEVSPATDVRRGERGTSA
ncbi:hypothetical protein [Streptomyces sp. CB01881]|uniref:hypothetical protein n=1 Tax=Streptomyces sp. CB01881 TaxID=2078691 RepID=UPI0011DFA3CB|nr:hypothetical protein [Streptomyces sp. CB01881]TYC76383.1 hypothetical protein EH183_01800 [Streptomyces sp. CB01881]